MPIADPVLMHVLDTSNNAPAPVSWTPGAFSNILTALQQLAVGRAASAQLAATGTAAVSGDNSLIAAPGSGKQIGVVAFTIQNLSATPTTMILKWGSVEVFRFLGQTQGAHVALAMPPGRELIGADNQPLLMNLSGANSCGYAVIYYVLDVQ